MRILRKLTLQYLKMNRTRTIVTIIGIILSIGLIMTIAGLATSAWESSIRSAVRMSGDYDFLLAGDFDRNDIEQIQSNRNVRDIYAMQIVGLAKNEMAGIAEKPFIQLVCMEEKALAACDTHIVEGRFPQNDSELLITPQLMQNKNKSYHVGDTVTLSIGKRCYKEGVVEGEVDIDPDMPYWEEYEEFKTESQKTYTIVGIIDQEAGFLGYGSYGATTYAYVGGDLEKAPRLYIRLTDEAEKNYIQVISQITGVKEYMVEDAQNHNMSDTELQEMYMDMLTHNPHMMGFDVNGGVLRAKGCYVENGQNSMMSMFLVVGFVMLVVVSASVFIIRNSFAISVTEKTKLYGMLASVGATPRQIRFNVFFEAAVLGLFGIPIGILLGVGVTAGLVGICNALLKDILYGTELVFSVWWIAFAAAFLIGIVTLFFSALSSAEAAAKISPMEAIRSSKEIKVGKRQKKNAYKCPKFIKKIFGIGGSIAWKNMKRSRRQYRTTVLSIIISVAIYLTAAAFVNYNIHDMQSQSFFKISAYNMQLSLTSPGSNQENQDEQNYGQDKKITPAEYAEYDGQVELIRTMDGVKKARLTTTVYGTYLFSVKEEDISSDIRNYEPFMWLVNNAGIDAGEGPQLGFSFCAVDDDTFAEICRINGKSVEECRDKCFIKNKTKLYAGDYTRMGKVVSEFENPVGMKLTGTYTEQDWVEVPGQFTEDGYPVEEPVTKTYTVSTEIAGTYPQDFVLSYDLFSTDTQDFMVVSQQWLREHIDQDLSWSYTNLIVDAENPSQLAEELEEMKNDEKITIVQGINNYAQMINSMRSAILVVQIFVYGFILIIALIGVTNIFNTITTNMKLRQKEFAMLRSIGTTKKEFNRMIHLESLLYTMKSLLIAIPIGLIGSAGIQWMMNLGRTEERLVPYFFPWFEILLCLVVVLLLLLVIMRFSIAKVSKQNIIETIRNDNI